MRKYLRYLMTICIAWLAGIAVAQETTVSGIVTDDVQKKPLEGVTVRVSGTNISTVTSTTGSYSIRVKPGNSLLFSFIGYAPQTII